MAPQDLVLLTGRDPARVQAAAAAAAAAATARVEGRVLDVRDGAAIDALAAELGEVDIVFSNATARMSPDADPADEVDAVAETNNLATTRMLRAFAPRLRPGGRLIVVASALGTLDKLDDRVADRFAAAAESLDAVDALVADWRQAVHDGRAEAEGYGTWLNIPSKVAQVAAVRAVARERRAADLADEQAHHGALPGPDRHRRLAPVVRRHERGADPGRGRVLARRARPRRRVRPRLLRRARPVRQRPPLGVRRTGAAHGDHLTPRAHPLANRMTFSSSSLAGTCSG